MKGSYLDRGYELFMCLPGVINRFMKRTYLTQRLKIGKNKYLKVVKMIKNCRPYNFTIQIIFTKIECSRKGVMQIV